MPRGAALSVAGLVACVMLACLAPAALAAPVQRPGGNFYDFYAQQVTWADATATATANHARLVAIGDAGENTYVQGLIPGGSSPAWIGATDDGNDTDAVFTWVTNEPFTFTNFALGEPDDDLDVAGNGEALAMQADGTWIDTDPAFTGFVQGFVIEWTDDLPDVDNDGLFGNDDPDDDNDSVLDGNDNCPITANADQADADGDATGNACDADDDGDGVQDSSDNCPLDPNPDQADYDGDTQGDSCDDDGDGDGVADASDAFPRDPARSQADAPTSGSPTPDPGPSTPTPLTQSPLAPAAVDVTPPNLMVRPRTRTVRLSRLRRSRRVSVVVTSNEAVRAVATATRRRRKAGRATGVLAAGVAKRFSIRLTRRAVKRGSLSIVVVVTDAAGNTARKRLLVLVR